MFATKSRQCSILFLVFILLPFYLPLQAQTVWLNQESNIALELLKPNLDGPDNTTFITSTAFLTVRVPISSRLNFVGELPFAYGEITFAGQQPKDKFGNPYFGVEIKRAGSPIFVEAGGRLPLVRSDNFASFVGFFSDVDRLEAFATDNYAFLGAVNFQSLEPGEVKYRFRAGSSLLMQTEDGMDPDVFLFFSGQLGYEREALEVLTGVSSRFRLTPDGKLGQRSFLQLGFAVSYKMGILRPGLNLKIPIEDDLREIVDVIFGLNLGLELKKTH